MSEQTVTQQQKPWQGPYSHSLPYVLIGHLCWALPPQEGLPLGLQLASPQTLRVKNTSVRKGSQGLIAMP